ncbi:MAG: hypothetical protein NTY19_29150 [Planctomycetota bacterium]|nr:hypothetical protein [Planctomycetota bacterium]
MSRSHMLLGLMLLGGGVPVATRAQEFRVETDVFVGGQKKPVAQNLTLFTSGLVYDFPLMGPSEIAVLDLTRGRFVLLDTQRKVKTTLTTQELLEFTASMKAQAQDAEGVVGFAVSPQFEQSFDQSTGWLTLSSKLMTYRLKGSQPKQSAAVDVYRQFADWYARLNATRPGNLPPFARLELNKAAAERGLVPDEVELLVAPSRLGGKKLAVRSRHMINWLLSNTDRKRVDEAGDFLVNYQAVKFQEYRSTDKLATKP